MGLTHKYNGTEVEKLIVDLVSRSKAKLGIAVILSKMGEKRRKADVKGVEKRSDLSESETS